jgi:hypothetical protein
MNSKSIGADLAFAWPSAELAVMGPSGAVEIIYRRELLDAADPTARRAELIEEYTERYANPYNAAERGYIDDVIDPAETRSKLIAGLAMLRSKRESSRSASTATCRSRPMGDSVHVEQDHPGAPRRPRSPPSWPAWRPCGRDRSCLEEDWRLTGGRLLRSGGASRSPPRDRPLLEPCEPTARVGARAAPD